MKTIYKSLMALAAALLLVPAAQAQTRQYKLDATSGFAIDKYVMDKNPNANGEYTLRIETFATGEVTVEKKSIPSDIVLVLDASGSMNSNRLIHPTMRVQEGNNKTKWAYSAVGAGVSTNTCIFIKYPDDETGKYYPVKHGHAKVNGSSDFNDHWMYFTIPADEASGALAQTKYIYGTYTSGNYLHDEKPEEGTYATNDATIYTGPLYRYPKRTEALKYAVGLFIDKIDQNNEEQVLPYLEEETVGNQICILQYTGNSKSQDIETLSGDTTTKPLIGFTPVHGNVTALKNAANSVAASGNTPHDAGLKLAQLHLQDLNTNCKAFNGNTRVRLRTVVFFTDGQPAGGNGAYWIKKYSLDIANELKERNPDATKNQEVKIFAIAFNPRKDAGEKNDKGFLEHMSSNYGSDCGIAQSTYALSGTSTGETKFYMDAATVDIDKIFEAIAESVGGGGNTEYENTPLLAVDMVSSSFKLPQGIDKSRVKVYTAQCLGTTGNKVFDDKGNEHDELAFAKEILVKTRGAVSYWVSEPVVDSEGKPVPDDLGNPTYHWTEKTEDIDENIEPVIDLNTNTVTVGGFDYEALWCGLDPEHDNQKTYNPDEYPDTYKPGYRGFKLIIEFPIVVAEGALGGPDVATNYTSSGVYQTDENGDKTGLPIVRYPVPSLPIPVNLWIEKRGLLPGESATFTILKKLVEKENESDPEPQYVKFARVNLIGAPDGSPVVEKLLNLDPRYYYKIWEEGWSWSYTNQAQDLENAPSTETITSNPIVITNTYDDPEVKHAEAAKRNEMGKTD